MRTSLRLSSKFILAKVSSLGFGSYAYCWFRAINTCFRCAFVPVELKLAVHINSLAHSSIGTPSPLRAPTLCKHTVSGLFHRPHRATFHLSLTVLFTIDHETYLAFPDSPGWFPQHFLVSRYSRTETGSLHIFAYGTFTHSGRAFQPVRLTRNFVTSPLAYRKTPTGSFAVSREVSTLQPPHASRSRSLL